MPNESSKLKIVMLGDFAVGKTSLVNRYVQSIFSEKYLATLGVHISKKDIVLVAGGKKRDVSFILWDLNGEDGFHTVLPQYLKGAAGAILVCDVTRGDSRESISRHEAMYKQANPYGLSLVAMNKSDLLSSSDLQKMEKDAARRPFAGPARIFWTSAKMATNVESLFETMATLCLSSNDHD